MCCPPKPYWVSGTIRSGAVWARTQSTTGESKITGPEVHRKITLLLFWSLSIITLLSVLCKSNLAGVLSSEHHLLVPIAIGGGYISDTPWNTIKFTLAWFSYFFTFTTQEEQNSSSSEWIFLPSHQSAHMPPQNFLFTSLITDPRGQRQVDPHFLVGLKFFNDCSALSPQSYIKGQSDWWKPFSQGKHRK